MSAPPHLRPALPGDLDAILELRRSLPMPEGVETRSGGFLLATDPATYSSYLRGAQMWVLELDARLAGFSLAFDDGLLRTSALWQRREQIVWDPSFDAGAALDTRVAYFDQLALAPGVRPRYWGAALGLRALAELFETHSFVLTTTVLEPIHNRAALPYLGRVGARELGSLDEQLPGFGRLRSAVHVIEAQDFHARVAAGREAGPRALRRILSAAGLGP